MLNIKLFNSDEDANCTHQGKLPLLGLVEAPFAQPTVSPDLVLEARVLKPEVQK